MAIVTLIYTTKLYKQHFCDCSHIVYKGQYYIMGHPQVSTYHEHCLAELTWRHAKHGVDRGSKVLTRTYRDAKYQTYYIILFL